MASVRHISLWYNSVYLVDDGGETVLVDTGPDYRGAWQELTARIGTVGPSLVVATHGHQDHAGMGSTWQAAGVAVALHTADFPLAEQPSGHDEATMAMLETFVSESGAPREVAHEARRGLDRRRAQIAAAKDAYPEAGSARHWPTGLRYLPYTPLVKLSDDMALGARLQALSCPGHTPGNIVLFHAGEGWLFSGDQLLPGMTPTPGLQLDGETRERFRSLPAFLESLLRLEKVQPSRCFPGHGEPFDHVVEELRTNISVIEGRTTRVLEALREGGPTTMYAVAERLYPRALRRRFWQIMPTIQGHLDLLEQRGAVAFVEGAWQGR